MTRSGNSLSKTSTSAVGMSGGNVYNETEGFDNSGSIYRFTRLNSTGAVDISAGYFNGTNASSAASATPITGLSSVIISHHARLNTSNKGIAINLMHSFPEGEDWSDEFHLYNSSEIFKWVIDNFYNVKTHRNYIDRDFILYIYK